MVRVVLSGPCQDPDVQALPFRAPAQILAATSLRGYMMLTVFQVVQSLRAEMVILLHGVRAS